MRVPDPWYEAQSKLLFIWEGHRGGINKFSAKTIGHVLNFTCPREDLCLFFPFVVPYLERYRAINRMNYMGSFRFPRVCLDVFRVLLRVILPQTRVFLYSLMGTLKLPRVFLNVLTELTCRPPRFVRRSSKLRFSRIRSRLAAQNPQVFVNPASGAGHAAGIWRKAKSLLAALPYLECQEAMGPGAAEGGRRLGRRPGVFFGCRY